MKWHIYSEFGFNCCLKLEVWNVVLIYICTSLTVYGAIVLWNWNFSYLSFSHHLQLKKSLNSVLFASCFPPLHPASPRFLASLTVLSLGGLGGPGFALSGGWARSGGSVSAPAWAWLGLGPRLGLGLGLGLGPRSLGWLALAGPGRSTGTASDVSCRVATLHFISVRYEEQSRLVTSEVR